MASNIKWFKRAYRALSSGQNEIWEAIKVKLPPERIEALENTFLKTPDTPTPKKEAEVVEVRTASITKTTTTNQKPKKTTKKVKTSTKKTKTKTRSTKKNEKPTKQNN